MNQQDKERIEKEAEEYATHLSTEYTDRFKKLRRKAYIVGATAEHERFRFTLYVIINGEGSSEERLQRIRKLIIDTTAPPE